MSAASPIRILLVEDLSADAELAERELRRAGFTFVSLRVETKAAFIRALQDFTPDLILSDYALPEFDGAQALKLAQAHDPALPVILLTGSLNEETAVACMKAGATDYVIKESLARLPYAVREALDQKRNRYAKEESEKALRDSETRYRMLVEQAADGIFIADSTGRYIEVNRAGRTMLGYSDDELRTLSLPDVTARDSQTADPLRLDELGVNQAVRREVWLKRKDSSLVPVEISQKLLPNGHLMNFDEQDR